MKKLIFILMVLIVHPVYAGEGWEGSKVKVPKDTLLCDYFHMEDAVILKSAGDNASVQSFIDRGYCVKTPNTFYAVVVKDASTYTDHDLMKIMINGVSLWVPHGKICGPIGDDSGSVENALCVGYIRATKTEDSYEKV